MSELLTVYQATDVLTRAAAHTIEVQICTDLKRSKERRRVLPVTPLTAADFTTVEEPSAAGTPPIARVDWSQQFDDDGRATGAKQQPNPNPGPSWP